MSTGWLVAGLALIVLGLLSFWKPRPLYWLSDRTNGLWARMWASWGRPEYLEFYEQNRTGIRLVIPPFLVFMGAMLILYAQ
jgi:hypothetical protein